MTTTSTLAAPKNLDPTKLHSPAEYDKWKSDLQDYADAIRAEEARERLKAQTREAHENRVLTREEWHAEAVKRETEKQAKEAARQAEVKARADDEAAYLASLPDTAEIIEHSEFVFLTKLAHRLSQGYEVTDDSIRWWTPGLYHLALTRSAQQNK